MRRFVLSLLSVTTLGLLSACGGGGSNPVVLEQAQAVPARAGASASATGRALDVAIDGDGQFAWRDDAGNTVYSREAGLGLRADGTLVNRSGAVLLAAADAVAPGTLLPLVVPGTMAPRATDRVQALMNLDSTKPVVSRDFSPPFDARDANTYHDAFGLSVYDATGRSSYLVLYFTKVAEDRWEVRARLGANGTDAVGELAFDPNGNLPATTQPWAVTLSAADLALPLTLRIDLTGTTQYAASFSAATPQQPGYPYGTLMGLDIGYDGQVRALYNNGQSRDMARIPLARFDGSETFVSTAQGWRQATGAAPLMAWPGLQTTGTLRTGALETDARLRTAAGQ